jgi:RNA polymerase sigma factor (sigma-70 family)
MRLPAEYRQAEQTARRICEKNPQWRNHLEDAVSEAVIALLLCSSKYDPQRNDSFANYAHIRVVGSVKDYLRRERVSAREDRPAKIMVPLRDRHAFTLPVERDVFLQKRISRLGAKHQQVIRRIYWDGDETSDIARDMNVSESRIRAIHRKALADLRERCRV